MAAAGSDCCRQQALLLLAVLAVGATTLPVGRCQSLSSSSAAAACNSLTEQFIIDSPAMLMPGKRYTTWLSVLELASPVTVGASQLLCIHSSAGTKIRLAAFASPGSPHFRVQQGGALYLDGVDLVGSTGLGGVAMAGGTLDMAGGQLTNCNGLTDGSISVSSGGGATNARLDGVSITQDGGRDNAASTTRAIGVVQGADDTTNFVFDNLATFSGNRASWDGGSIAIKGAGASSFIFNGPATFTRNTATAGDGGAIHMSGIAAATLTFNAAATFEGNTALAGSGGAIYLNPDSGGNATLTFAGTTKFTSNAKGLVDGGAGALHAGRPGSFYSAVNLVSVVFLGPVVFDGNRSPGGSYAAGALFLGRWPAATVTFQSNARFSTNVAAGSTGIGAVVAYGHINFTGAAFLNNMGGVAGAMRCFDQCKSTFLGAAMFHNNNAATDANVAVAGALLVEFADANFTSGVDFTGNNARGGSMSAGAIMGYNQVVVISAVNAPARSAATAVFTANTAYSDGSAGAINVAGPGQIRIFCPASFSDNIAKGGAFSAGALVNDWIALFNSTVSFTGNKGGGAGAVLTTRTLKFVANMANFGANSAGGAERDMVSTGIDSSFTCGLATKPQGTYVVDGDVCAPSVCCTETACTCPNGGILESSSCTCYAVPP